MDRLQIFIAVAAGFMLGALLLELLPVNIQRYPHGTKSFFIWAWVGMALVVVFERYGVPRLKFVEHFFKHDPAALKSIETHDESLHPTHEDPHDHGGEHDHHHHGHHHHHNLQEAENCELSHDHGHLHTHTHREVVGHGEVCSAIACFMICSFFDGIALSSIQVVDPNMGIIMVMGVILHLLPEGVLSGAMALAGGASARAAAKVLYFIGGSFVLGALIPRVISGYESIFLSLSCGVLMFVTLVQLVPTALKLKYAPLWIGAGSGLFLASHTLLEKFGLHIPHF